MLSIFKKLPTKEERYLLLMAIVLICEQTLFIYPVVILKSIFPILGGVAFPFIYLYLLFRSLSCKTFACVRIQDIFTIIFCTLIILFTCILYPNNVPYIYERLDVILQCIPFFLLGLCMSLNQYSLDTLAKWCCLGVIVSSIYRLVFQDFSETSERGYNMDAAYVLLLNALIVIDFAIRTKKYIPIICSVVALFYTLAMGTRGPIVVIISYILINIYIHTLKTKKESKKILITTIITILLFLFTSTSLMPKALLLLQGTLEQLGFSTRILDFAISNEIISATSGRDEIVADLLYRLQYSPLLGYGVYGEWPLGYYSAHNIYVEICFHLGYPIGILLILSYIICVCKAYFCANNISKSWILILSCFVFIRGFFGGSYLSFGVFLLLGYCLQTIRKRRYF